MFEDEPGEGREDPTEHPHDPAVQAREKADELRMHAELAAVFEGHRKFDAVLRTGFDPELARDIQRTMAKLEKSRSPESPLLPEASIQGADELLKIPATRELPTSDYHIHRRPGELMIVRWLAGDEVETYYERFQAHFDAALAGLREDEHQAHEWKSDPKTLAYLAALDAIEVRMADRYLRDAIRQHKLHVLSTQTADEINISYLAETIMGVATEELVGPRSAPPDHPTDRDLAWFFKLFALRGMDGDAERMCFFAYLQKSDDTFDSDE